MHFSGARATTCLQDCHDSSLLGLVSRFQVSSLLLLGVMAAPLKGDPELKAARQEPVRHVPRRDGGDQ